ncbi:MAG TPA: pyridoxal-phosphate dependent enzyme [Pilimelia sp.]|nr:pyridoxal-phosphate dependent enzyme [Pilimelia sp.]
MRSDTVVDAIGRTPLVRLGIGAGRGVAVYAKLELSNLFAMKDRVARQIILAARRSGELAEGAPLVESSSGTMALGVALVGTALGHPVHIVTDPRIDSITLAKLTALGCEVHVVRAMDDRGWQGARLTRLAELMAADPATFWPRQYENPQNPAAYGALAEELLADLGRIDVLVGAVGSGGSLCGTARALRRHLPDLYAVGVDCVGSVLFGQPDEPRRLQSGLGNSLHPPNLDHAAIDEVHWLNDREAFTATRELARAEKLFGGNTSGSVYRVLTALAARLPAGSAVVGILPDRGDRYVDTVYSDAHWAESGLADLPLAARPRQVPAETVVRSWSFRVDRPGARPPALVFVEANTTGTGMLALRAAGRLGYEAVLAAAEPGRYADLAQTGATVVRCATDDPAALRAAVERHCGSWRVAGVTTTSEFYLTAAAELARAVGLPGGRAEALAACRDKGRLRATLTAGGLPQPRFEVVRAAADAAAAARRVGSPCVVKPVDDSGSTRVVRCADAAAAAAAAADVLAVTVNGRGQPTAGAALVEEYLEGPEYSVEMFGVDGAQVLLGIVEKEVTGAPHFVECQHIVPAAVSADLAEELVTTTRKALGAVGLERGPSHTELRVTAAGATVVEINPRLAGGRIPELFRLGTGVDLLAAQVRYAAGLPVSLPEAFTDCVGIRFLLPERAGLFAGLGGVGAARALPGVVTVAATARPGQEVSPPTDAYGRVGYVLARGADRAAVAATLAAACRLVRIRVEGDS